MSNVMSMKSISNHVSRNGFDLSRKNCFTAKVGELLPVMCEEVLPGDKFKINASWFSRTMPVNTAAFTRIKEYYDFFFVPTRLLWRYSDSFYSMTDSTNSASSFKSTSNPSPIPSSLPQITRSGLFKYYQRTLEMPTSFTSDDNGNYDFADASDGKLNELGFSRWKTSIKLLSYLGYGDFQYMYTTWRKPKNLFPLLAYQKVYNDYYRFGQWESPQPYTYNVDYYSASSGSSYFDAMLESLTFGTGKTMFDLRYCNWQKDMFMGILPTAQYNDVATVGVNTDVDNSLNINVAGIDAPYAKLHTSTSNSVTLKAGGSGTKNKRILANDGSTDYQVDEINGTGGYISFLSDQQIADFSILALRRAEAEQKWREITNSGNPDYRTQMEKHFNVDPGFLRSNMCEYVGGTSSRLDISEVVNTNLSSSDDDADIAGKGVGSGNGNIDFEAKEHGIFLCIYHALPLLDYDTSCMMSRLCEKLEPTDFAIPEFDKVGMEELPTTQLADFNREFTDASVSYPDSLGYVPRYIEYKTAYDQVHGEFCRSLQHWVAPITRDYVLDYLRENGSIDYGFFKVHPNVLDPIFVLAANSSTETDQLLCNAYFDFKAVRNLDYDGLPY